jgi:methylated-DNA-[protein]-cysteine S-methyltransferase
MVDDERGTEMIIETTTLTSPLGELEALGRTDALYALTFVDRAVRVHQHLARCLGKIEYRAAADVAGVRQRIQRYFAGDFAALEEIVVDAPGTTFQKSVWQTLRQIPSGSTRSYGEVARAIGHPTAVRAVATANANNPVWLVIPCHRVIGGDGSLRGYAAGIERKRWLLTHEHALTQLGLTDVTAR